MGSQAYCPQNQNNKIQTVFSFPELLKLVTSRKENFFFILLLLECANSDRLSRVITILISLDLYDACIEMNIWTVRE